MQKVESSASKNGQFCRRIRFWQEKLNGLPCLYTGYAISIENFSGNEQNPMTYFPAPAHFYF
jgi:hypothetical protein